MRQPSSAEPGRAEPCCAELFCAESTRASELARLLPLWPGEIGDTSLSGRAHLVAKLKRALASERRRGHGGHWAYDLARHAGLVRAWQRERAQLAQQRRLKKATGAGLKARAR